MTPIGVTWRLSGPSHDFIAGRVFEAAQEVANEQIYSPGFDDEIMRTNALLELQNRNCIFLLHR